MRSDSASEAVRRIAADIGGTFTDIAVITGEGRLATRKVSSTPANYADAVIDGIQSLMEELDSPLGELEMVLHGCTVATNAILEHEGASTALVTTRGFRDVLELRRIRVPALYDPLYEKPEPLVPRNLRFEVSERMGPDGEIWEPLVEEDALRTAERIRDSGVEAVAVCFLHAYANPSHERRMGEILDKVMPGKFVSLSVDVLPQKREYERTSTTVINSYVGPPVRRYLDSMVEQLRTANVGGDLMVMQSSGGILDARSATRRPAQIVECGPAAGVIGAAHVARLSGFRDVITLDMGGTTAKASIIQAGELLFAEEYEVGFGMSSGSALLSGGGYSLSLPVIDISEVGAGGGSIAWLDKAGSLKVGPKSAGASPGPACYGLGNPEPTVTDANLVLGFLNPRALAGGSVAVHAELAHRAVESGVARPIGCGLLEAAHGIHTVANANMMRAVKAVTTYRGRDPRDFALFAFGGSGGVHAVDLARVLQVGQVVVPMAAGVFSSLGLLFSNLEMNETAPFLHPAKDMPLDKAEAIYGELAGRITPVIGGDPSVVAFSRQADVRFRGQAYELTIPFADAPLGPSAAEDLCKRFEAMHLARYGHAFSGEFPVEVVNLRLVATRQPNGQVDPVFVPETSSGKEEIRSAYFGADLGLADTRVMGREGLGDTPEPGPIIVEEYEGTIVVPPDCTAAVDQIGNVIIKVGANS